MANVTLYVKSFKLNMINTILFINFKHIVQIAQHKIVFVYKISKYNFDQFNSYYIMKIL